MSFYESITRPLPSFLRRQFAVIDLAYMHGQQGKPLVYLERLSRLQR